MKTETKQTIETLAAAAIGVSIVAAPFALFGWKACALVILAPAMFALENAVRLSHGDMTAAPAYLAILLGPWLLHWAIVAAESAINDAAMRRRMARDSQN